MSAPDPSPGEWAGIAAALVIVLGAIGKGVQWLTTTRAEERRTRAAGLQEWEDKLAKREADFDAAQEARFAKLEASVTQLSAENLALRMAFELVAAATRASDPQSGALARAEKILSGAFALGPIMPDGPMNAALHRIDQTDLAATAVGRKTEGQS